jgi:hypothetical protein
MAAPSVTLKEIDLSTRVPGFAGVYAGIVLQAPKGPIGKPYLVTNDAQLLRVFTPNETIEVGFDTAFFSALSFLEKGNKLWVSRAAKQPLYAGLVGRIASATLGAIALTTGLSDPTAYAFDSNPDVPAIAEVISVTCVADVAGSLNNKYFLLSTASTGYYVWLNVGGLGVDPAVVGRTGVEVAVAADATAAQVALAVQTAVDLLAGFVATVLSATITITLAAAGVVPDATAGDSGFTVTVTTQGAAAVSANDEAFLIYGSNPGAWADDVGVKVTNYATNPDKVKEEDAFLIEVFKAGNEVVPVESFLCSRVPGTKDGYGRNIYIEDVLISSNYIRAIDNIAITATVKPKDIATVTYLGGGSDGLAVTDADMISAAQLFSNKDEVPVTVLMDGGFATPAYGQALDTIAQSRGDCVAILSVPFASEASSDYLTEIQDYRKTTLNLNSSYSALVAPHALVYDKFNDRQIYVSPDGYMAAAISFTAANYELWYPAAGFKRGLITVLDLRRRFTKGEMDALYDVGVNPIRFTPGKGIAIWGQKTLLSRPSALDRLNVRLLLCVIEPAIANAMEGFLFELNDVATRALAVATIDSYLSGVKSRKGITDYKVISDDTNNTPDDIDNYRMNVDIYIKPTRSVEYIPIRMVVVASGLSFAQAAAAI